MTPRPCQHNAGSVSQTIAPHGFRPEPEKSYLLHCLPHGGGHVGEWRTDESEVRRVLAFDVAHELHLLQVLPVFGDPMNVPEVIRWAWMRQALPALIGPARPWDKRRGQLSAQVRLA
jgi:hypothetical protein